MIGVNLEAKPVKKCRQTVGTQDCQVILAIFIMVVKDMYSSS